MKSVQYDAYAHVRVARAKNFCTPRATSHDFKLREGSNGGSDNVKQKIRTGTGTVELPGLPRAVRLSGCFAESYKSK